MIVYFAYCKNAREAAAIEGRLARATPTLIFSRILTRRTDLDVYNTEMLRSSDEQMAVGPFAFRDSQISMSPPLRALAASLFLVVILAAIAVLIGTRVLSQATQTRDSMAALAAGMLCLLIAFCLLLGRAFNMLTPARRAVWRARRSLRAGRPVLIAASDAPPEDPLPPEVRFFWRTRDRELRKSA